MPQRIRAVLKANKGPTWSKQDVPNKVARESIYFAFDYIFNYLFLCLFIYLFTLLKFGQHKDTKL